MDESKLVVAKFGGSSVKDAASMNSCVEAVKLSPNIKVVILSATYNTTNELEEVARLACDSLEEAKRKLDENLKRHLELVSELMLEEISGRIQEKYERSLSVLININEEKVISPKNMDDLYSLGEITSSYIFSKLLEEKLERGVVWVDARTFLTTDCDYNHATPLMNQTEAKVGNIVHPELEKNQLVVTQGFIGASEEGNTTTLGREGSDYSASIIGCCLNADEIHIYTDVDGIYSADPNKVDGAVKRDVLSYREASMLTRHGAKVLHERTMQPCEDKKIPILVKSTFSPTEKGTKINTHRSGKKILGIEMYPELINEVKYLAIIGLGKEDFDQIGIEVESIKSPINPKSCCLVKYQDMNVENLQKLHDALSSFVV